MFKWLGKAFNRPIEKKSSTNTVTVPVVEGSFLSFVMGGAGRVSATQAMEFYQKNSAIATAVDLIAGCFEQIQPVLKTADDKFITSHPVLDLLRKPNGFENYREFTGQVARHYLLKHDSHISGLGFIKRPPIQIFAVKPNNVSVMEDTRDSYPDKYIVPSGAGKGTYSRQEDLKGARFYDGSLKEFYHIMGFSSRSTNIQGDSPIEAAALEAKQLIESSVHNLKVLRNGGRLSLIITFKDEEPIDDDEHRQRTKRINERLAGSDNAGAIATISGSEVSIDEVGKTNKDMDFAKLNQMASNATYLRYHVPLPLVTNDASTFNNMQTAILMLYDFAILPLAEVVFAGYSRFLLPRFNVDPNKMWISYDPRSITALMERTLEQLAKRKQLNIETTNELRPFLSRDPVESGDTIYQPANLVPLGTDLFADDSQESIDDEAKRLLERDGIDA